MERGVTIPIATGVDLSGLCLNAKSEYNIQIEQLASEILNICLKFRNLMRFFNTFRGRLSLIMAFLLVSTLGVQYYLNLVAQNESAELRDLQSQALVAGIAIGSTGLTAQKDRVKDLVEKPDQTFLDEESKNRIKDIIIIDDKWRISDSLNPDYWPTQGPDGELQYRKLSELKDLPPLMEAGKIGPDIVNFPNQANPARQAHADEAHAIPVETSEGRWYIMVLLNNDRGAEKWRLARPLIFTLAVWLISTAMALLLVWRFTRPIANLSSAARSVAAGNMDVRVPDEKRNDEMGKLSRRFNEMIAELEKSKELEEQLRLAEKSAVIGRLGSAIAHEIRNPLNYINLTLDHLRTKYAPENIEDKAAFEKLTSQLKAEVARINQQITDFLNYSRPATVNSQPTDLRAVIDASLRIVENQAADSGIKISVIEHEDVPRVPADAEFLRSVFNNLFINAIQAMETDGGQLKVKIDAETEFVTVEIADTGKGIPHENLENIFEPYFSTKETGTGLGLAIVKKVIEMHNGTITVSSAENEGTTFTIKLPK